MLMCSVGQKFGKGTRTPCLCHTKSVSLFERTGRLKATQWLKTETTSLTCLVVNTAFQLRSQFLNWAVGQNIYICGCLCFLTAWCVGSKSKNPPITRLGNHYSHKFNEVQTMKGLRRTTGAIWTFKQLPPWPAFRPEAVPSNAICPQIQEEHWEESMQA